MDNKKARKQKRLGTVEKDENTLQNYYKILRKYYKNISKMFQIVLTFLSKCNIYNTKKNT